MLSSTQLPAAAEVPPNSTNSVQATSGLRCDSPHHSANKTAAHSPAARPLARLTGVQILATGSYAPPQVVRNEDLAEQGFDADWILQRTGIRERRRAPAEVATSDLAYQAGLNCLEQAGVPASDVDLIVVGTMTPDYPMPSTACRVQHLLGASCPAFDVNAACAGFAFALATGMQFVATGNYRRVLVIGADAMTRVMNPEDRKTFPLFGDGAGAVLLGAGSQEQGFLSYTLGSDGSGGDLLQIPGGGTREPLTAAGLVAGRQYMQMEGRAVFKWAVRLLADSMREMLAAAGITAADLALVVLHQANKRIIDAAVADLDLDPKKVVINLDRYGNTSAGSIPLALDEIHRQHPLRAGDHVLFLGFGAGLAWGGGVFKW